MNRRELLGASGAAMSAWALGNSTLAADGSATAPAAASSAEPLIAGAPVLTEPTATSVEVLLPVGRLATGWIEYGSTEKCDERTIRDSMHGRFQLSDKLLRFEIDGLKPGSTVYYRCCVQEVEYASPYRIKAGEVLRTPAKSFRTFDPGATSARFTVWNDTHENKATLTSLTEKLRATPTDFLLWNGDVTNDIHKESAIVGQFLSPAGQAFAERTPVIYSTGNHDVRGRDAWRLGEFVVGPRYRAFRQGPVACIVLDSGEDKPDTAPVYAGLSDFAAYRSAQATWLAEAIRRPEMQAPYRVVFVHIPLAWDAPVPENWPSVWGQGIKGWVCEDGFNKWNGLLKQWGAQVAISGHTHRHIAFDPAGDRPYTQIIGGGPKPEAATIIAGDATPQRLRIEVRDLSGKPLIEKTFRPA